jgi:hypothetical protein
MTRRWRYQSYSTHSVQLSGGEPASALSNPWRSLNRDFGCKRVGDEGWAIEVPQAYLGAVLPHHSRPGSVVVHAGPCCTTSPFIQRLSESMRLYRAWAVSALREYTLRIDRQILHHLAHSSKNQTAGAFESDRRA